MQRSLAVIDFHGDELEGVELDGAGWVSLPSLLHPFGKRVDNSGSLVEGWARTRVEVLTSRKGEPGNPRVTLIHVDDAALAIARLDRRGMDHEMKLRHDLYLRECARVLAQHFNRTPAPVSDMPPWARVLLEGIGGGVQLARAEAKEASAGAARAEEKADRATQVAEEARKVAKQAAVLAGSRGVLDALADTIPPGRAAETPDAAVSRRPREGYKSMRSVAWEYALPRTSEGALLVSRIAEAIGIFDDPTLFHVQDVVIGGRVKNEHRTYSPRALELLDKPLRAAHAVMVGLGFTTTKGGAMVPLRTGTRSRAWVLKEMFDAAIATTVATSDPQQAMPFEKAS